MEYVTLTRLIEKMKLVNLTPELEVKGIKLRQPDINRPALQMTGYLKHFDSSRLQIIGFVEHSYFSELEESRKREVCDELMGYEDRKSVV